NIAPGISIHNIVMVNVIFRKMNSKKEQLTGISIHNIVMVNVIFRKMNSKKEQLTHLKRFI
ncbi:hypothetical protein DXA17_08960, partial [Ruminococcus sp. AM58-7XD]